MSAIEGLIRERSDAIVRSWIVDQFKVQIQVESVEALRGLTRLIDGASPPPVTLVGSHREGSVVMVRGGADRNSTWSVWARAGFGNYKTAFLAFLKEAYGAANAALPSGFEVDHLSNKAFAPQDGHFIRLEAIDGAVNRSWGTNFEKARTTHARGRDRHRLSYMSCAKLGGHFAPRGPNDTLQVKRIAQYFSGLGLPEAEALEGINNMLRHAYGLRGPAPE